MPNSYVEYSSGLTETTYSIPFKYIAIDDVAVKGFDGSVWSDLTVDSRDASAKTVTLDAAPSAYEKIRVWRNTSTAQLVDFQNGSRLSERDLDTAYQQGLFVAQEVSEDASTTQFSALREASNQAGTSLSNFESQEIVSDASTGLIDGTNATFGLSINPRTTRPEAYRVAIDGVMQSPVDAYTISIDPAQIVFASAPPSGSKIVVVSAASAASAVSVDDVTLGLTSNNRAEVKDGGITPAKLSTGAPSWGSNGIVNGNAFRAAQGIPNAADTSTVGFAFGADGDTGMFSVGTGGGAAGGPIAFYLNGAERMRIDGDGTVLVGTTDSNTYDNTSTSTGAGIALHGGGLISAARVNSTAAALNRIGTNGPLVDIRKDGSGVGNISVTSSATSYNSNSDYRLKEDIIEMDDSLERLKALKPCNFAWKADGSRTDGFIAHEAQEVVPEAVTGTKDAVDDEGNPDYQGIDQSKLVPLLTKALQEALTKIETLEARVEVLENA